MARGRTKTKRSAAKQAKLERRRSLPRTALWARLVAARTKYDEACKRVSDCPVVCERCGLLQDYEIIDWPVESETKMGKEVFHWSDDLVFAAMTKITPCPGPLELVCGGLTCITIEHYQEDS